MQQNCDNFKFAMLYCKEIGIIPYQANIRLLTSPIFNRKKKWYIFLKRYKISESRVSIIMAS